MNIIITESQYKLILEGVNKNEILSLVKKSNSLTKEYGMDITKNSSNDSVKRSINHAEKFAGISVEDILNQFQSYVDGQSETITNLMISNGDYKKMVGELLQKLASLILTEYNKIGNFKKTIAIKLIKNNIDRSKNSFKEHIASELNSYAGNLVGAMFRRLPNWVDDAKSIDSTTKQKYREWSKNVENYIEKVGYPYWTKISETPVNELYP
jgi:hypothetical protein